jgi:hypothetical protein
LAGYESCCDSLLSEIFVKDKTKATLLRRALDGIKTYQRERCQLYTTTIDELKAERDDYLVQLPQSSSGLR